ncbi:MAG: hypothetical protein IKE01_04740 [Clostridia bacterium]|nr:hypothetical protein [Clostridia bacterium]
MKSYTDQLFIYKRADNQMRTKYDEQYINRVHENILQYNKSQVNLIVSLERNAEILEIDIGQIPRATITANNKLVEMYQKFKSAGIPISVSPLMDFLVNDMLDKISKASDTLQEYAAAVLDIMEKQDKEILEKYDGNIIKKSFFKIKDFFIPPKPIDTSLSDEDQNLIESKMKEYIQIDSQISKYSIEVDLIPYIIIQLDDEAYLHKTISVMKDLEQDLKKLDLGYLVPQIQSAINDAMKRQILIAEKRDAHKKSRKTDSMPSIYDEQIQESVLCRKSAYADQWER